MGPNKFPPKPHRRFRKVVADRAPPPARLRLKRGTLDQFVLSFDRSLTFSISGLNWEPLPPPILSSSGRDRRPPKERRRMKLVRRMKERPVILYWR
jgi:hypothetical protein